GVGASFCPGRGAFCMIIDLHTHSLHSDGTDSPRALVQQAAQRGIDVVALTDHDTAAGWAEAEAETDRQGITFVPGVELSTKQREMSVHLLAYWVNPASPTLQEMMEFSRAQ